LAVRAAPTLQNWVLVKVPAIVPDVGMVRELVTAKNLHVSHLNTRVVGRVTFTNASFGNALSNEKNKKRVLVFEEFGQSQLD